MFFFFTTNVKGLFKNVNIDDIFFTTNVKGLFKNVNIDDILASPVKTQDIA